MPDTSDEISHSSWQDMAWVLALVVTLLVLFGIYRTEVVLASLPYLEYIPGTLAAVIAIVFLKPRQSVVLSIGLGYFVGLLLMPFALANPPLQWYLHLETFTAVKVGNSLPLLGCVMVGIVVASIWLAFRAQIRRRITSQDPAN
ncbi:hypothetical protein Pan97_03000 [Bremerella volcania]|uniref:Uncharacterized protein n=1 Tax=Bremerella volcania TaxID=2527984 RepID=A0A518C277_9BACT|nr:hypothetical protein [Bremerella volcania]QDU73330.1 hypothetical protein Pan97_03000 [Bremerella volcania]